MFINFNMSDNKRKILNDPVYGFISIPDEMIFDLIEHPYFQRLRRIQQLGLTHLVYPGALHTRFHHALGSMYLMDRALEMIKSKGTNIDENDFLSAVIAILLHDIGHGPFSHALENSIVKQISHEEISLIIMQKLNIEFDGRLSNAINIFLGNNEKKFLHQLVSGQLDVDRLDYLTRDSFFTGVSEGIIGTERIIKMMSVFNNELVIEEKGIHSIEKFLISRQLMYHQVYLHKTVISAEILLIKILQRAHYLAINNFNIQSSLYLKDFLNTQISKNDFMSDDKLIDKFCHLDDFDIISSIKEWTVSEDKILSFLSKKLINRNLFKTVILDQEPDENLLLKIKQIISDYFKIEMDEVIYLFDYGSFQTHAYDSTHNPINILFRNGSIKDISEVSSTINIGLLSGKSIKYQLTYPKEISELVKRL